MGQGRSPTNLCDSRVRVASENVDALIKASFSHTRNRVKTGGGEGTKGKAIELKDRSRDIRLGDAQ